LRGHPDVADGAAAIEQLEAHDARHLLLDGVGVGVERLPLGREPRAGAQDAKVVFRDAR